MERDEAFQPVEAVAEEIPRAGQRAEEVAEHGEAAADDVHEQQGRPARAEDPPLDFRRFQVGVNRGIDSEQLPGGFQVIDALAEAAVHGRSIRG